GPEQTREPRVSVAPAACASFPDEGYKLRESVHDGGSREPLCQPCAAWPGFCDVGCVKAHWAGQGANATWGILSGFLGGAAVGLCMAPGRRLWGGCDNIRTLRGGVGLRSPVSISDPRPLMR